MLAALLILLSSARPASSLLKPLRVLSETRKIDPRNRPKNLGLEPLANGLKVIAWSSPSHQSIPLNEILHWKYRIVLVLVLLQAPEGVHPLT